MKAENTYVTKEELALAVKKFKKRERTRSKSVGDDPGDKRGSTYKGKKNPLGRDFKPLKCFKCKCDCEGNCNHPCVYHLADKCNTKSAGDKEKPSLNLFMKNSVENIFFTECKKRSEYGDRRKMEDFLGGAGGSPLNPICHCLQIFPWKSHLHPFFGQKNQIP